MSTKVSKLTQANILALRDVDAETEGVQIAETYAIFPGDASHSLDWLQEKMEELDNRTAHPYASLHAVVRKLSAQVVAEASPATPLDPDDEFRPQPGEYFQVWKGLGYDDTTFRVREYAPMTAAPEKIQKLYGLPMLPTEAVHAFRLEKVPARRGKGTVWAGVAFVAFPVEVMVPPGVVKRNPGDEDDMFVLAMSPAQTAERIKEIDADFKVQLAELLAEHEADDALDLPREVWHKLERWRSDQYALAHGRDPQSREYVASSGPTTARRVRGGGGRVRPSSGACEHCGLPTKGGRFTPGHDAKLKGDLGRAAQDTDPKVRIPALAESALRAADSSKWAIEPLDEDAAEVDKLVLQEGFLASRNAARADAHKEADA